MKLIRQTTLTFKEGNSDKVYETDLIETPNGFLVNFRYGKRTATLRESTKTKQPVDFKKAEKIYNSLLVSKINKGYKVSKEFDLVNGQTLGKMIINPDLTRDQNIIARLNEFAKDPKTLKIGGYSLGRSVWKAGELRIQEGLVEVIDKLLQTNLKKQKDLALIYYSMLWALGRSGNPKGLPLIKQFKGKLPKNTDYMLTEVELALTENPENNHPFLPEYHADFNDLATIEQVTVLEQYEKYGLEKLASKEKEYINIFMEAHQIENEITTALAQLKIEDISGNYLKKYLSTTTFTLLSKGTPICPKLEKAIKNIILNKHNQYIISKQAKYKESYDLYMRVIKNIDLNQLWGHHYYCSYALGGDLDWIWNDSDKKTLRDALKATGEIENVQRVWTHVMHYKSFSHSAQKTIKPIELAQSQEQLKLDGVYDEVINTIANYTKNSNVYSWLNGVHLPFSVRAKYETSGKRLIENLFKDQFWKLYQVKKQSKQQLLQQYQEYVLGLYGRSFFNSKQRLKALELIKETPIDSAFMQIFRRLYKIAEFRGDAEVLAILNYRIETTNAQIRGWGGTAKPFNQTTKDYFRRRFLRTLKEVAKFTPETYTHYAKYVLLQADDQSTLSKTLIAKKPLFFPKFCALNFILFHRSRQFTLNYCLTLQTVRRRSAEVEYSEAYPKLWDQALDDLAEILIYCKAEQVDNFAYQRLINKQDFLATISTQNWCLLVQKPYEKTALLAIDNLQEKLHDLTVMKAVLNANFDSVRAKALEKLDGEILGENIDLLVLMLLSKYKDIQQFARDYLYTAEPHYIQLSQQLIETLIDCTDEKEQTRLIKQIKWLLLKPLKDKIPLSAIKKLLKKPYFELQQLAANLLERSNFEFSEIADCYTLMVSSEYPEIRAGALALLVKLDNNEKISHQTLLFSALFGEHALLRQKSIKVLGSIKDNAFKMVIFEQLLPYLFKAEPQTGFNDDILKLMIKLKPIYPQIEINLLWRLLTAKSKLAQWTGALILTARKTADFSVKQLVLLAKNPTETVRQWALNAFHQNPAFVDQHFDQSIRLLDNPWDDSRQIALEIFAQFEQDFWRSERIISVCDQTYEDVQQFGRSLITQFFDQAEGELYLLRLSQHPSQNIQLFVSHFLTEYATDKTTIIIALESYFQNVLSQVNRGRVIKDRIIDFLFKEAEKDQQVAEMVARLFTEQSISRVIADKMRYIHTLFKIQQQFKATKTPLKVIEPEVRAI